MASNNVNNEIDKDKEKDSGVSAKLETLIHSIKELKTSQDSIKRMFDKLKVD